MTVDKKFLISVILDRSGSMSNCEQQTISGFNEFLHQQQVDPNGEAFLSLTLFDADGNPDIERRFLATPIKDIPDLGTPDNPYQPRGMTPLYDAIGITIVETEKIAKDYDSVLIVIQTDGEENASKDWTREKIFDLITKKRDANGDNWSFVFMGADQNAYAAGASMGVAGASTMSYGSAHSYAAFGQLSASTMSYRMSGGKTGSAFFTPDPADEPDDKTASAAPVPTAAPTPVPTSSSPKPSDSPSEWRKS